jgi:hypothetical protein
MAKEKACAYSLVSLPIELSKHVAVYLPGRFIVGSLMLACKLFQTQLVEAVTELDLESDNTTDAVVISIAKRFHNHLETIELSCCCELSDVSLVALALHCPRLTSVCIFETNFEDFGVLTLAQYCPNMESVKLGGCYALTDASLTALGKYCKELKIFDLHFDDEGNSNFTDRGLNDLVDGCPKIESLKLGGCSACTNFSIFSIGCHLPGLKIIDLSCYGNGVLTDAAVKALAKCCSELVSVNLSGCEKLNDGALIALSTKCPALTDVNISYCSRLTSKSTLALVKNCSRLASIDISYTDMADKSVTALAAYCPDLLTVGFEGLNVTDAALTVFAKCCRKIKEVYVGNCAKLSNVAFLSLADNCPELHFLSLGCNGGTKLESAVNDSTVLALALGCPRLNYIVGLFRCPKVTINLEKARGSASRIAAVANDALNQRSKNSSE